MDISKKELVLVMVSLVLASLLLISRGAGAGPPVHGQMSVEGRAPSTQVLHYQGRLLDPATGNPKPDDTYHMIFSLYDVSTGGTALWSETKDVTVTNGLFSTLLGDTTPLDPSNFDGRALWLGITVGTDPEATPRQPIAHVAYALHAENADTVDGQQASDFAAASHMHSASDINSGTLSTARFSAYDDLVAEGKIGSGDGQVAAGNHNHDARYYTESESDSRYVNDNTGEVGNADVADGALSPAKIAGTAWTSTNDGSGSGLNADMLDGQHAGAFATAEHAHSTLPVAHGFIRADGSVASGTSNVTSTWDSTYNRYEITISGHSYFWTSYSTMVTLAGTCNYANTVRTGSVSGNLLVYVYDNTGSGVQCDFQFVTFKP